MFFAISTAYRKKKKKEKGNTGNALLEKETRKISSIQFYRNMGDCTIFSLEIYMMEIYYRAFEYESHISKYRSSKNSFSLSYIGNV